MVNQVSRLPVFPMSAEINKQGHLAIGGCDTVDLANEYGTPLYLFDELNLRTKCKEYVEEFGKRYASTTIIYACKAFINKALVNLLREEGLGLDVVSGGELGIAQSTGFPLDKVYFNGNNKSAEELSQALDGKIGCIVVDNFHELKLLGEIASKNKRTQDILLRLTPGVDPHTHKYTVTGNIDSKFGFPLARGEEAITAAMSTRGVNLVGIHFHIGSLIFENEPYLEAIDHVLDFVAEMKKKHGFQLKVLDVGGGYAIQYTVDAPAPPLSYYAEAMTSAIIKKCRELKLELPKLVVEPGRSIVGRSGVALYKIGAIKDIPGVRVYVSIDGGMGDNIRPALYGSVLEAVIANRMKDKTTGKFTISGKFCESGDILIKDIELPAPAADDILAVAGCGAYSIPQASNYNAFLYPPIVLVNKGKARLIRRRQILDDLTSCDL